MMAATNTKTEWDKLPWQKKVILGQEAIVSEFGLGRVVDFGRERETGGYDYITLSFYADLPYGNGTAVGEKLRKRFAPEVVSLIDPTGLILTPYKAKEPAPVKKYPAKGTMRGSKSSPIQSRVFPSPRFIKP